MVWRVAVFVLHVPFYLLVLFAALIVFLLVIMMMVKGFCLERFVKNERRICR